MNNALMKLTQRAPNYFISNARQLTLYGGSVIVLVWTVLRHITNGINFDVVGQIGLADQWAHGLAGGAQLGVTNYLLKMPLYALVNLLHFISPMNRLLLLAAAFNVVTYLLLFKLIEKLLQLYDVDDHSWLYLAMAWLATIYGVATWADYANSRNLETVGGILVLYLVLKYMKHDRMSTLLTLAGTASLVFFADSLQAYVCGAGACLYVALRWLRQRNRTTARTMGAIVGAIISGFIGAQLLFVLAKSWLPVSFLALPVSRPTLSGSTVWHSIGGTVASTLQIFDANFLKRPFGPNVIRELLNAVVLTCLVGLVVKVAVSKNIKKYPLGLLLCVIITNWLVYMASGQALHPESSRYLIMLPLLAIVFAAFAAPANWAAYKSRLQFGWLSVIVISSVLLLGALAIHWPNRHAKDQHIYQTVAYMQRNTFAYGLASRELAVTSTYFAKGQAVVLPLQCTANHRLHVDNLFYDRGAFIGLDRYTGEVPIILQSSGIQFGNISCNQAALIAQFGQPKREQVVPGVGMAEIYDASSINLSHYK